MGAFARGEERDLRPFDFLQLEGPNIVGVAASVGTLMGRSAAAMLTLRRVHAEGSGTDSSGSRLPMTGYCFDFSWVNKPVHILAPTVGSSSAGFPQAQGEAS
jgi:hypothetical protein